MPGIDSSHAAVRSIQTNATTRRSDRVVEDVDPTRSRSVVASGPEQTKRPAHIGTSRVACYSACYWLARCACFPVYVVSFGMITWLRCLVDALDDLTRLFFQCVHGILDSTIPLDAKFARASLLIAERTARSIVYSCEFARVIRTRLVATVVAFVH